MYRYNKPSCFHLRSRVPAMRIMPTVLLFIYCLSFFLLPGCAVREGQGARAGDPPVVSAGPISQDMRLGVAYRSALGEDCYELYQANGANSQARAYCYRDGAWTLLPPIYLDMSSTEFLSSSHP